MADTIEEIAIGNASSLVAADLTIDFTTPSVTGTLSTLVDGAQVPAAGLALNTTNGVTTVSGTTVAGTGVSVQFAGQNPSTATASVAALGLPVVSVQETAAVVCYVSGTRILTDRGDVAVELLQVGDRVVTASGEHRPIRWIGSRLTDLRRHPCPLGAMPVRISAHAFGPSLPSRDLLVSPGHSLCVDVVGEVLIPAMALINGTTIAQEDVETVTYWHVELDTHDILLAENMPAESYLEMGNRGFFVESELVDLDASPDAPAVTHADFCRPFHVEGALVQAVHAQLSARAEKLGWRVEDRGLDDLHLLVDGVRVEPQVRGLIARFAVPARAKSVWLVSGSTVPATVASGSQDRRTLGLSIAALTIDDGFGAPRVVTIDDCRLGVGFYGVEHDGDSAWRWTSGRAHLPMSLWEGVDVDTYLRVDFSSPALPRWTAAARSTETSGVHRHDLNAMR